MDRDTLLALAERCEKADVHNRPEMWKLHGDIAEATGAPPAGTTRGSDDETDRWFINITRQFQAPEYSASLDAATSLFGPHTLYRSGHDGEGPDPADFFCQAMTSAPGCHVVHVVARTEALARTAAALGALAYATLARAGDA